MKKSWHVLTAVSLGLALNAVPALVAAYPIWRGSRITVRQAIGDYGLGQGKFGRSVLDRWLGKVRGLSRPLLLSLRNTFRRRGRLVLTLGALSVGGAGFIQRDPVIGQIVPIRGSSGGNRRGRTQARGEIENVRRRALPEVLGVPVWRDHRVDVVDVVSAAEIYERGFIAVVGKAEEDFLIFEQFEIDQNIVQAA